MSQVDDESILRRGVRPGVPALYKTSFMGIRTNIEKPGYTTMVLN